MLRHLKSPHTVPLVVLGLVVGGAFAAIALAIDWMPQSITTQSDRLDTLMWFVVWASGAIFTIVVVVLVYASWRWRTSPDDDEDGPPLHGHTLLETVWTAIPAALLVILAVYSYLVMVDNEALARDRNEVLVTAEQFAWTFTYPGTDVSTGDLRLPVDRQVELVLSAKDVIHDFFVPQTRVKIDAVPGIRTHLSFTPTTTGTFPIICYELCGAGHNLMRAQMIVMTQVEYDQWLQQARQQVQR